MILNKNIVISPSDERLLYNIGQRVADSPVGLSIGSPKTDGKTIWLPMNDHQFNLFDLEGLMGHEGCHIRFKSIIDPTIPKSICPENPKLAQYIINILEDARINFLLKLVFPGYYDQLMVVEKKYITKIIQMITEMPKDVVKTELFPNLLFNLMIIKENDSHSYYNELLIDSEGSFIFKHPRIGRFWKHVEEAYKIVYTYFSFNSTIIASQIIIDALQEYIKEPIKPPESSSSGVKIIKKTDSSCKKDGDDKEDKDEESKKDKDGKGKKDKDGKGKKDKDGKGEGKKDKDGKGKEDKDGKGEGKEDGDGEMEKSLDFDLSSLDISAVDKDDDKSGISLKNLSKKEKRKLKDILDDLGLLKRGKDVEKDIKKLLDESKDDISSIIKGITDKKKEKKVEKDDKIFEERERIDLNTIVTAQELQAINKYKGDPINIYNNIIMKNRVIIHKLKMQFASIQNSQQLQRGSRRGIISNRDLSQVVASGGRFNRPFLYPSKSTGAYLTIAVDESGSMDRNGMRIAREASIILCEALQNTLIKFSIIGFGAIHGKNTIIEKVYKSLQETKINKQKMGSMWVAGSYIENRDGTSFKGIAKHHFHGMQGGIPMMIVISDGKPHHGGTSYTGKESMKKTAKAVTSLKQQGIKMFALSIDSQGGSYLKDIYGKNSYFVVKDLNKLKNKLFYLVRNLVKSIRY